MIRVVRLAFEVYFWIIIARALLSWFRPGVRTRWLRRLNEVLYDLTEPVLAPLRRMLPDTGGFDFSPVVAVVLLSLLERLVVRLLVILI